MRFLIRFITSNAAGGVEHDDKIIEAPAISIGRATDQVLHIKDRRARLQHATIKMDGSTARITSNTMAGVIVNGRSKRENKLAVGDVIEVGANILRIIEPNGDVDFALSFELGRDASGEHLAPAWSSAKISDGLNKRKLSWIAAATVFLLALLIPASGLLHPGIASFLRNTPVLPDDSLWLSGPIHSVHATFSADCQACHSVPFERVGDATCLTCHEVNRHVSAPAPAVMGSARCASCHLEHNEPPSLVNRHQGLCADCHRDLPQEAGVQHAVDFLDGHPDFRVTLLTQQGSEDGEAVWSNTRVALAEALTGEQSNLKFNHRVHLNPDGIVAPDGKRVVDCSDCHQTEPGGARMRAITMDDHCITCHALTFDPDDPSREVPHGDPEGVLQNLIEYYSAKLLGADSAAVDQRLRRPGQALSREERDRAAAEARVQALRVAEDMFERRACINCHEVTRIDSDAEMPWHVVPVRLTDAFFPNVNFSHATHDTETTDCSTCHKASSSETAGDLLMPDIGTCRDCHGSGLARRNGSSQIPSTCVMCHSFHFPGRGSYP
jgi:hypothetical protein